MVIVTAAIQSIPKELYEAVGIDGGAWRAKFRYVTWPHLIPTLGSTALTLGVAATNSTTLRSAAWNAAESFPSPPPLPG